MIVKEILLTADPLVDIGYSWMTHYDAEGVASGGTGFDTLPFRLLVGGQDIGRVVFHIETMSPSVLELSVDGGLPQRFPIVAGVNEIAFDLTEVALVESPLRFPSEPAGIFLEPAAEPVMLEVAEDSKGWLGLLLLLGLVMLIIIRKRR